MNLLDINNDIHNGQLLVHKVTKGSSNGLTLDDGRSTSGIPFVTEYNLKALKILNRMQSNNFRVEPVINYPYRREVMDILKKLNKNPELNEFYRIDYILWDFDKPSFEMWMDGNRLRMNAKEVFMTNLYKKLMTE